MNYVSPKRKHGHVAVESAFVHSCVHQIFDVTKGEKWDHVERKMKATCRSQNFFFLLSNNPKFFVAQEVLTNKIKAI